MHDIANRKTLSSIEFKVIQIKNLNEIKVWIDSAIKLIAIYLNIYYLTYGKDNSDISTPIYGTTLVSAYDIKYDINLVK